MDAEDELSLMLGIDASSHDTHVGGTISSRGVPSYDGMYTGGEQVEEPISLGTVRVRSDGLVEII